MDIIQWTFLFIIILFIANRLIPKKGITNITVQEAKNRMEDKNIQFIDVRTPGEYKANHHQTFKNIPLANLSKQVATLNKDKEVVVICQSGMRSARAAAMLKKLGFANVSNVKGGMNAWY